MKRCGLPTSEHTSAHYRRRIVFVQTCTNTPQMPCAALPLPRYTLPSNIVGTNAG